MHLLTVFFFQAEDGIRDRDVTGVQTCALPISRLPRRCSSPPPLGELSKLCHRKHHGRNGIMNPVVASDKLERAKVWGERSEERRVGKEGRSEWAPGQLKKEQHLEL